MKNGIDILEEIGAATKVQETHGTLMTGDATFEDGVIAALMWVMEHPQQSTLIVNELLEHEANLHNSNNKGAVV